MCKLKKFFEPEIEIEKFNMVDVITASDGSDGPSTGDDDLGWDTD